ncbi:response regulator [Limnohabitans sp. 15K]|uniref:response regulator n=1 Tax=Limnohabitans sp. 15K TaxID=1100706 RepID=UPI000C1E6DB5|nr:response regulator [Limnohabitans sp. 15K]PIT82053.1 response regulator [Limnohabitans sp. 15K]
MADKQATILMVDDEELLLAGIQEMLEMQGYVVITALDGQQAMVSLTEHAIDLVITDLVMPNMDGVDFVQELRKIRPDIPVIVVSGSTHNIMERYGIDSIQLPGADASLSKPFKGMDLMAQIQELLALRT